MKKTTAKVFQVVDFIQWNDKKELQLSPKYQRNKVWNETAKSYLLDSILRGLPIPPVFIRQEIDIKTKSNFKEIVDGQQRIRTIIEYVSNEEFSVKKSHNKDFGGKFFSELDDDTKEAILQYEIVAEIISEKDESTIYDMFARLNSNNYVLNSQEIRNAKFWGEFKVLAYKLSSELRDFFLNYKIFSDKECARMKDTELVNSIIVLMMEGLTSESPKSIDNFYEKYDDFFSDANTISTKILEVMSIIYEIYTYFNGNLGRLDNKNYFFTLFMGLAHQMFGIKSVNLERNPIFFENKIRDNLTILKNLVANFISLTDCKDHRSIDSSYHNIDLLKFKNNHIRRTTNKTERAQRLSVINLFLGN